jgi:hypothetical protein
VIKRAGQTHRMAILTVVSVAGVSGNTFGTTHHSLFDSSKLLGGDTFVPLFPKQFNRLFYSVA